MPLFTGHLLCTGTLELLCTQCEPGAATAWGRRFQPNMRSQSKMLGYLGAFLEVVTLEDHRGGKHVQMRVQKKGSREEEQELRWGA